MFDELRRVGVELFADEPEVAARNERLYSEILTVPCRPPLMGRCH